MAAYDHAARRALFLAWTPGAPLGERLGAGRYASVFSMSGTCAVKVLNARSRAARKQAYREHVVGMLQALLLMHRITPHLPWHYGADVKAGPESLDVRLYMERFTGTLEQCSITSQEEWLMLLFQLAHAALAMALVFGIVQNDAYPRNALLRPCEARRVVYAVGGRHYALRAPFLAALSDYGIASGDLLAAPKHPEVARGLPKAQSVRGRFACCRPEGHVLAYDLPVYARDVSLLLKWPLCAAAPWPVKFWSLASLRRLDVHAEALDAPQGLLQVFHEVFEPSFTRSFGLTGVHLTTAEADFVLTEDLKGELLPEACEALKRAQELDAVAGL